MSNTIVRNTPWGTGNYRTDKAVANGDVLPGDLIEYTTGGKVIRNDTASDKAPQRLFAIQGLAGQDIEDKYISGQDVDFVHAGPGWNIQARLTTSQTIIKGDMLVSTNDGTLKKAAGTDNADGAVVARAGEAVTTTSAVKRINVDVA